LLEKGLRWKVGSGRRISIWDECWLPGPVPQRIQSTQLMKPCLLKVFHSTFPQDDCVVWGGKRSGIYSVLSGYRLLLRPPTSQSLDQNYILATSALRSIPSTIVHWSLSPVNVVKVNVDDGFILAQRKVCLEVIIKDEYGQILGACSWLTNQVSTMFAAEALAVVCGLRFAYDMGFLLVMLDGDSKSVIDKINDSLEDLSKISALIWEAKEVSKFFRDSRFRYNAR
ncbi:hypothetical protein Goklo_012739, partial [Gossypium klotzschianum]|nr:hypothetical protein [Gossypium klotzschianum]